MIEPYIFQLKNNKVAAITNDEKIKADFKEMNMTVEELTQKFNKPNEWMRKTDKLHLHMIRENDTVMFMPYIQTHGATAQTTEDSRSDPIQNKKTRIMHVAIHHSCLLADQPNLIRISSFYCQRQEFQKRVFLLRSMLISEHAHVG
ncbi:hypothetical protein QFZ78_003294 [Paenibacillus sp. V4I5]|nr:hypothetical protein [Paenibacillus sp. V4I5]